MHNSLSEIISAPAQIVVQRRRNGFEVMVPNPPRDWQDDDLIFATLEAAQAHALALSESTGWSILELEPRELSGAEATAWAEAHDVQQHADRGRK
jgi:hypothetical protein